MKKTLHHGIYVFAKYLWCFFKKQDKELKDMKIEEYKNFHGEIKNVEGIIHKASIVCTFDGFVEEIDSSPGENSKPIYLPARNIYIDKINSTKLEELTQYCEKSIIDVMY